MTDKCTNLLVYIRTFALVVCQHMHGNSMIELFIKLHNCLPWFS